KVDFQYFRPVMWTDHMVKVRALKDIEMIEKEAGFDIYDFEDYIEAVDTIIKRYFDEGIVATKIGVAYWRTLAVEKSTKHEAETVFNKLKRSHLSESLS